MNETPLPQGYDARPADYDGQLFAESQMRAHADRAINAFLKRSGQWLIDRATRNAEIIDAVDAAVAEAAAFDRAEINRLRAEAARKSPDGDKFMDYEQLMAIARMTTMAIDGEERLHHQWDGDGEYCERCGDKDWFAGPECKPTIKGHACRPEDREMVASPAGQELLSLAAEDLMRGPPERIAATTATDAADDLGVLAHRLRKIADPANKLADRAADLIRHQAGEIARMESALRAMVSDYESPEKCLEAVRKEHEYHMAAVTSVMRKQAEISRLKSMLAESVDEACDCETEIHADGAEETKCSCRQMMRSVEAKDNEIVRLTTERADTIMHWEANCAAAYKNGFAEGCSETKQTGLAAKADRLYEDKTQILCDLDRAFNVIRGNEKTISILTAERDALRAKVAQLRSALADVIEMSEPPEKDCHCHLSPPCKDCYEYGGLREAISIANAAMIETIPATEGESA